MRKQRIDPEELAILLGTPEDIQNFVSAISGFDSDFDLISGEYTLDAKSILGLYTLDWSKPATLRIHTPTPSIIDAVTPFMPII